jgi:TM2 domain-containing membrane protein YozV
MSDGPQPPGLPDPSAAAPTVPQAAWPEQHTRPEQHTWPQTWPEQPTVPGRHVSLEPAEWPEQPPPWPRRPAAPGPEPYGPGAHTPERHAIRPPPERPGQQHPPRQWAQEWAPLPLYGPEMRPMMVAPRNPAVSVLLSVFIPGLGSMVNDSVSTGVTILILNIIGWMLAIVLIGIPLAIGTWIWGLVDAHRSAQRWNRAHGIPG